MIEMVNINFGGDNNGQFNFADHGSTMTVIVFNSDLEKFETELKQLKKLADDNDKQVIDEALAAIKERDESKFKRALEKIGSFIGSVFTGLAGSVLLAYMRQVGLLQ